MTLEEFGKMSKELLAGGLLKKISWKALKAWFDEIELFNLVGEVAQKLRGEKKRAVTIKHSTTPRVIYINSNGLPYSMLEDIPESLLQSCRIIAQAVNRIKVSTPFPCEIYVRLVFQCSFPDEIIIGLNTTFWNNEYLSFKLQGEKVKVIRNLKDPNEINELLMDDIKDLFDYLPSQLDNEIKQLVEIIAKRNNLRHSFKAAKWQYLKV